ncbi:hypothetical protein N0V94_002215 [Neodidymelliopsis sp. IMI 364377]|nr:hypothetical protein N0V94_002215 [Neodidymelliopsis sp. IMI 364377]
MARATRSKPAPKEAAPEPPTTTTKPLPASTSNPPKLFVLPKDTTSDARIVTLDNPANNTPSRYYFCPSKGFYEFTRIAAPKKACRSWLITSKHVETTQDEKKSAETNPANNQELGSGFVTNSPALFLATPIDLLFLILPALVPQSSKDTRQHFLALDEYVDTLTASSRHWKSLFAQYPSLNGMLDKKMRLLCDMVDAGDETMFRISHDKLLAIMVKKAERMVKNGLPPSMEEKFVKSALEVPVMSIRREDSTLSAVSENSTPAVDSQASTTADALSQITDLTVPDTDTPSTPTLQTPPEIPHLLRLRTALTYLTTAYLPPTLQSTMTALLSTSQTPDFTPLTTHLSTLAALKAEALALRSISDNISRKRQFECDEDKIAEREEKKRKKDEEEKKKKSEGRGIKALKKVDTSGMKKMSAFFSVKPKKA